MEKKQSWFDKTYSPLVGGKILRVLEDAGGTTVVMVRQADGKMSLLAVDCDAEGNGPGFLRVVEVGSKGGEVALLRRG